MPLETKRLELILVFLFDFIKKYILYPYIIIKNCQTLKHFLN